MLKAIVRPDLNEGGLRIPIFNGGFLPEAYAPCVFDAENIPGEDEWNTRITAKDGKSFTVNSIDLDFLDKPESFFNVAAEIEEAAADIEA